MTTYIVRRLLQTVIVVVLLSVVTYMLMALMPGDPVDIMASSNPKITSADLERLREKYGLDKPILERYKNWALDVVQGDLGYSRTYRIPVGDLIGPRLLNSFILSGSALLLALIIGIPLGVFSGLKPNSRLDYFANMIAFTGISTPSFFLALILILVFAQNLGWLPSNGTFTPGMEQAGFWDTLMDRVKYLILPTLSLTALQTGVYVRYARSSMMEAMRNDFIRTAKAKGMTRKTVVWVHAFRNALIPIITIVALSLSFLFSGALINESIFGYLGIGKLLYDSIIGNDFNVAMVSFMITITMVLIMNLVADIAYAVADPRISYS